MLTNNQVIEKIVNSQVRKRVKLVIQPEVLQNIMTQEINSAIATAFNERLESERDIALEREQYQRIPGSVKRNGFKPFTIAGLFGRITLQRPVARSGALVLPLVKALKSAGTALRDVLAIRFWLRGTATRAVAEELNAAIGTKLSYSTVSKLTNTLEPVLREWETRPIPKGIKYLFLDAIYLPVRRPGFTSKQALLAALGVTEDGRRHVLGFLLGDKESSDSWKALVKDLLARGLDRQQLNLVISDEHKGIESAVKDLLGVSHQLCVVHLLRNVRVKVAAPHRKVFIACFRDIFWAKGRDEANRALGAMQGRWGAAYPGAVALVTRRFEDHMQFQNEPEHLWTLLRSSNLIERFNLELRRRMNSAGTMHSELEVLKLTWAVSLPQEARWEKHLWKERNVQEKDLAIA
jgi:transposase-like protein